MGEHFCLKWNNHQENLTRLMTKLLEEKKFVDVTLICEMKAFKAHQTILCASSAYFERVLEENQHPHPIIILKDVKESELTSLLQYMYKGEVSVREGELTSFLKTARALKVRGLTDNHNENVRPQLKDEGPQSPGPQGDIPSLPKRPRFSSRIMEQDLFERHHSDSQSVSTPTNQLCKSSPKPSSSTFTPPLLGYSDNSNESQYPNSPSQGIKQEVDNILVSGEEPTLVHEHLGNVEHRSDPCHQPREWNIEYEKNIENQNYQKVELPKVPIPMTYNFSSQLQGTSIPGLYPCSTKTKIKKEQSSTSSYEGKPKIESSPSSSFFTNQSLMKNTELLELSSQSGGIQRKGGRFRPGWMENYSWLQYDECLNTMYCKTCRKWSSSIPDIRTSFVEGNGNFRLEIVNHHHKSKAHKLCMAKEEESISRLDPIINEENK